MEWERRLLISIRLQGLDTKVLHEQWMQPSLPFPLMKFEVLKTKKRIEEEQYVALYEGDITKEEQSKKVVDSQPRWRKGWMNKYPAYLIYLVEAPKKIQEDATFCPVPRVKNWKEHGRIAEKNPNWLNYPRMPGPKAGERIGKAYMVKTLTGTIKLFTGSPDLSLLTCIEVFAPDKSH
ncbi:hypothetical protein GOP47_0020850 [Adiantum capillus-veneris]|uniref:Uncharacterized protein n=1 Tax=Adiantum capillus-veneris TaxID=13818 RepID=A0A9D4Z7V3_ADICA|nr:hypothetical protein GOP47_0020850 [Adiantum capillus-veneris]